MGGELRFGFRLQWNVELLVIEEAFEVSVLSITLNAPNSWPVCIADSVYKHQLLVQVLVPRTEENLWNESSKLHLLLYIILVWCLLTLPSQCSNLQSRKSYKKFLFPQAFTFYFSVKYFIFKDKKFGPKGFSFSVHNKRHASSDVLD